MAQPIWKPQPKQALALACPATELFFGGARGGGKSDFSLADFTRGLQYGEDYNAIIFRKSYPELEELIRRSKQLYPALGGRYHKTERTWHFPAGSSLKMRYIETMDDVEQYQGHSYQWICFDELGTWASDYEYIYMMGTLRSPAGVPTYIRSTGNPGGRGHLWIKARFVDIAPPMTMYQDPRTGVNRMFIPSRLEDNKILMDNDPMYEHMLKNLSEALYRAHRLGDWNAVEGAAFPEWDSSRHVIKPIELSPYWFRFAAIDWGYSKPFSLGFYAVDNEGTVIRFDEWYGCEDKVVNKGLKLSAEEVARKSRAKAAPYGIRDLVADPSMWAKHGATDRKGQNVSTIDWFKNAGFRCHPANNDRVNGLNNVHAYFKGIRNDGAPLFQSVNTNLHLHRTLPVLVNDKKNLEDIDTDMEDHAYDELRYALNSKLVKKRGWIETTVEKVTDYDVLRF